MRKRKWKQTLSGLMVGITLMNSIFPSASVMAMEEIPVEELLEEIKPPLYEEVKEELDEKEIVKAGDLELEYGSIFDLELDFSNIEIPDNEIVKVTFKEAKNENGEDFTTWIPDTYKAVYYVEPLKSDHPAYQISRNLIVREEGVKVERIKPYSELESMTGESMDAEAAGSEYENAPAVFLPDEVDMTESDDKSWFAEYPLQAEFIPLETEEDSFDTEEMEFLTFPVEPDVESEDADMLEGLTEESQEFNFEEDDTITDLHNMDDEITESEVWEDTETDEFSISESLQPEEEELETEEVEDIAEQVIPSLEPVIIMEEITEEAEEEKVTEQIVMEMELENDIPEIPSEEPVEQADDVVTGSLHVYKQGEVLKDFVNGEFIYEDTFLRGAVFEVVALENIYTSDFGKDDAGNRVVQFQQGEVAAVITTDENGRAIAENLPLGMYEIREKNAPIGYVQNLKVQTVTFKSTDAEERTICEELTFTGERQKVELIAVEKNAENDAAVEGVLFSFYSSDDIQNTDGKTILTANSLIGKAVTGEDGKAKLFADIPCGNYYAVEEEMSEGFVSSADTLFFDAAYQGQEIPVVQIEKTKKTGVTKVSLLVEDAETGNELDGAVLQILDQEGNILNEVTSDKGKSVEVKKLKPGEKYILREKLAPYGYLRADDIGFVVEETTEIQKIVMKQTVPTALLLINKKGEFLEDVKSAQKKDSEEYVFSYAFGELSKVTFQVWAAEDIHAADGISQDYYKKDELVSTIETDEKGIARAEFLPVGKYYVMETRTSGAYTIDDKPRYIDLSYRDQDTSVVTYNEEWQNIRKRAEISVTVREKDTDRVLEGGIFELVTAEDILSEKGKLLLKKDTVIESGISNKSGKVLFHADLPVNYSYYIKERISPEGFVRTDDVKTFTAGSGDVSDNIIRHKVTFENERTAVELKKLDAVTGEFITGASLRLAEENGAIVYEWNSRDEAIKLYELTVDKVYRMTEVKPADGYVTAKDVLFTIQNTSEIQTVEMNSDTTKIRVRKTNMSNEQEVSGAELSILDQNDRVVLKWSSSGSAFQIKKLPIGHYTLREEKAPVGYIISSDVAFEIKDTPEIQDVFMESKTAKGKLILNLIDAENEEPLKGAEFELYDSSWNLLEKLKTDAAGHAESCLYEINQKYHLKETQAVSGYMADATEYEIAFDYKDQYTPIIEVVKNLTNKEGTDKTVSGNGLFQNPETGDKSMLWEAVVTVITMGILILIILAEKNKRKK